MRLIRLLITCIIIIIAIPVRGAESRGKFDRLQGIDSRRLLEMGEDWLSVPEGADSALMYFSVVGARYNPSASKAEKELAVKALRGKWLVYFSYMYDYPKAYEAIQEALEICNEEDIDNSNVLISLGGLLQVMAEMGGSHELYGEAVTAYSKGLREAVKRGEDMLADRAFVNLVTSSAALGSTDSIKALWSLYKSIPETPVSHRRRFAKTLYMAYLMAPAGNERKGVDSILTGIEQLPEESEYSRLYYIGLRAAADLANRGGDTTRSLELAQRAFDYATAQGIRDGEVEAALYLSEIQKKAGLTSESTATYDRYLRLKETVIGSRLIQRLDELRFMADIQQADKKLALLHEEKKRQNWIIFLLSAIVIIVVIAVWLVVSRNRKLTEANRSLRRQFELARAGEKRERKLIRQLEDEEKYLNSSLSDSERERIILSIHKIVEDTATVCSADFSVNKMAEMAGCNSKYLSQVINEEFGCNFNTFINKYRINEAARRLADSEEWGRITIEGIANSVGFKSRSTFVTIFKQFTGTTPSDYRRNPSERISAHE